ncbi:hypothetical protein C6A85_12325, partial [Mycobacterium sp. ITM-2017-0098]
MDPDLAARFTREVEPLIDVLTRGARRLARTEVDAEDLLQEALVAMSRSVMSSDETSLTRDCLARCPLTQQLWRMRNSHAWR